MRYVYTVVLETETDEQAAQVMGERLGYDEEYEDPETGEYYDYQFIDYWREPRAR